MKRFVTAFVAAICLLAYIADSQSCDEFTEEIPCASGSAGACKWVNGACRCASDVQLDILFGVDTSGSIGLANFQIQKDFIRNLVLQGINNGSRIGFIMFNTYINFSREIQKWDTTELESYVDGLYWTAGWTNTPELMSTALVEFADKFDPARQQVMMMITDGNPCLPASMGGCPQSVCQYQADVKKAGIRVVIIGVGDGLNTAYVSCLCQSDDDFIPVASFSTSDFNSIMGSLSAILCPISKEFKVTEVKAEKKNGQTGWNNRWTRYVEVYNSGINFNLNDISISGMIDMAYGTGPDMEVQQGQYVVFYDASDAPTPSQPSCHLCTPTVCGLSGCANAGLVTWGGYCYCDNSIYVACSNANDGVADCQTNAAATGALDACNECVFQDSGISRTSWSVTFSDLGEEIDTVTYDPATWIITEDGYSYELIAKGFDNDVGDNWAQSCSVLGTPGSDPAATCSSTCTANGCGTGGSCDPTTGLCDCNQQTGYYPQCSNPSSCTKCLQVPGVEDCNVTWVKNGSVRYAEYSWTDADRDGNTVYKLSYYDGASSEQTIKATTTTALAKIIDNYYPHNTSFGGFVQTVIEQCQNISNNLICTSYTSTKTMCNVITMAPTTSPTAAPTRSPTPDPTPMPTLAPTQGCPRYYWLNEDVCHPRYKGKRCECTDIDTRQCCLLNPIWTGTYDPERQHKLTYECKLDVQLAKPAERDDQAAAGSAEGYLLSEGTHTFVVGIEMDGELDSYYGCTMDIFWKLNFTETNCDWAGNSRRRLQGTTSTPTTTADAGTTGSADCDENSNSLEQAGLAIDVTSGWLKVWSSDDVQNATVQFEVTRLDCETGRSCYRNMALYGDLVIVNATTQCRSDCFDGRVYPMRIPVWYNYQAALVAPPGQEKELPAWLWWLVAALAVFLIALAILVYKYWWKNKATGAALSATQADLDAAVNEAECGFANDLDGKALGFNPLATGFNPNAPAGAANPNAPPNGGGGGGDFIRPNVQRPVFRQEYGQQYGASR
jgi:hypothetical protein